MKHANTLSALALCATFVATLVYAQERQTAPARAGSVVIGAARAKPDLTIMPALPISNINGLAGTGYCGPYNPGNPTLLFRVENNGPVETGPFLVHVGFKPSNMPTVSVLVNIPNVGPGNSIPRSVNIPAEAFGPGHLQFTVFADSTNQINESGETNNHDAGYCLQPEG